MPDAGFAGETLLGPLLPVVVDRATTSALGQLPASLASVLRELLDSREPADGVLTPEAACFHAADVLDRVLQALWHEAPGRYRAEEALDDLQLVHAGPVQGLQQAVLADAGVWPRDVAPPGLARRCGALGWLSPPRGPSRPPSGSAPPPRRTRPPGCCAARRRAPSCTPRRARTRRPRCCAATARGTAGPLVLGVPWLRTGREELRAQAVEALDAGDGETAAVGAAGRRRRLVGRAGRAARAAPGGPARGHAA